MSEFVYVSAAAARGRPVTLDVHLRANLDRSEDQDWWPSADVLYHERVVPAAQVLRQLREYPGCAVCAGVTATGGLILAIRQGRRLSVLHVHTGPWSDANQCALIASAAHGLLAAGCTPDSMACHRLLVPAGC